MYYCTPKAFTIMTGSLFNHHLDDATADSTMAPVRSNSMDGDY